MHEQTGRLLHADFTHTRIKAQDQSQGSDYSGKAAAPSTFFRRRSFSTENDFNRIMRSLWKLKLAVLTNHSMKKVPRARLQDHVEFCKKKKRVFLIEN